MLRDSTLFGSLKGTSPRPPIDSQGHLGPSRHRFLDTAQQTLNRDAR